MPRSSRVQVDRVAVIHGGVHRSHLALVPLWVRRRPAFERLQALDRPQSQVAPAVRRHLADLQAGEPRPLGFNPLGAVIGEVLGRERRGGALGGGAGIEGVEVL
jgi:hypothetical protein